MSGTISFNTPRDFNALREDAEISIRQGGLVGYVSPAEFAALVTGGAVKSGSGTYTAGAGSVAFAEAFATAPVIIVTPSGGNAHIIATNSATGSGFDVVATDNGGLTTVAGTFDWIAIG